MASDVAVQAKQDATQPDAASVDVHTCPECDSRARPDGDEVVCQECGLVVQEDRLRRGPNWFGERENDPTRGNQRQSGPVTTESLHDNGLSTEMWGHTDANGTPISSEKRRQLSRLRTWNDRSRFETKAERNLARGFGEIARMGSALGMSHDRRDQAARLFRSAQDDGLLIGRCIEGLASAAVYAVGRVHDMALLLPDIAEVSRVSRSRIEHGYDVLNRGLGLPTPPPKPVSFVGRIASDLGCVSGVRLRAEDLAKAHSEAFPSKAVHPAGVAAAAVWLACRQRGVARTKVDVAEAAGVTPASLRDRVRELEEVHDGE